VTRSLNLRQDYQDLQDEQDYAQRLSTGYPKHSGGTKFPPAKSCNLENPVNPAQNTEPEKTEGCILRMEHGYPVHFVNSRKRDYWSREISAI
jgi:hypothetical protein